MGDPPEDFEVNIEKTDDDEEINVRNEVKIDCNEYGPEYNANKQITLKSKDMDVDKLIKLADEYLKKDYRSGPPVKSNDKDKDKRPGTL